MFQITDISHAWIEAAGFELEKDYLEIRQIR